MALKLNLGAGNVRGREGYITVDANPHLHPDVVAVLPPLPFEDGCADDILASHFIEHLTDAEAIDFMAECWRVLDVGGCLEIYVPFAFSIGAVQDPTHKSLWVEQKFLYFTKHFDYLGYDLEKRFRLIESEVEQDTEEVTIHVVLEKLAVMERECRCKFPHIKPEVLAEMAR